MKDFNTIFQDKHILMLSDWVDPKEYHPKELEDEKIFISKVTSEVAKYGVKFDYAEVASFDELNNLLNSLDTKRTIIFNWCEQFEGISNSSIEIVRTLEKREFIFTGANSSCLEKCENKIRAKNVLLANKVNTPNYWTVSSSNELEILDVYYPVIAKYASMHSSTDITKENVVYDSIGLQEITQKLLSKSKGDVLIEEYIEGEEYSVPVWGNDDNVHMLPPTWIKYLDTNIGIIQTEDSKFGLDSDEHKNIESISLDEGRDKVLIDKIRDEVLPAYKCLGFRDYGRFEVRMSDDNVYIIDANPNPALDIETSLITAVQRLGYNLGEFVLQICSFAKSRQVV